MRAIHFLPLTLLGLLPPSCGKKKDAAPPQMPPPGVTFVPAQQETVVVTRDLPGRIDALRVADVRARTSGIILKRTFEEGADVKAGDLLFEIDPAPMQAALDSAKAQLTRAKANQEQANTESGRFQDLIDAKAVSQQIADNAKSAVAVANADYQAAEAAMQTAQLKLDYATVTAPISGRIGKAEVTEGALVGEGSATLLAVIQQLDPIYFDFTQSSGDLIAMRKAMAESGADAAGTDRKKITLLLDDGTEYEQPGKILFSETTVDQTTGMVSLRAEIPNPDRVLLPGMFARARVIQKIVKDAVTVPQRAVTRNPAGDGNVLVIDDQDTAQLRTIKTGGAAGQKWIVTEGLKPGEKVIMEGSLKARPGTPVNASPYGAEMPAAEKPAAPESPPTAKPAPVKPASVPSSSDDR